MDLAAKLKSRKRVLVIEDSGPVRRMVTQGLLAGGYQVAEAVSMEDALSGAGARNAEAVVTNVRLPGMNGIEGIRLIRSRWPACRIIAMSAGPGGGAERDDTLIRARRAGADLVLRKPFTVEDVLRKLEYLFRIAEEIRTPQLRVLVVEDSRAILLAIGRMLTESGYRAYEASSMEEAMESWDLVGADVVLTDIFMPGQGGIAGIPAIRELWPEVRVVAMSAGLDGRMADTKVLAAAGLVGADATIAKPFGKDALLAVLAQVTATT